MSNCIFSGPLGAQVSASAGELDSIGGHPRKAKRVLWHLIRRGMAKETQRRMEDIITRVTGWESFTLKQMGTVHEWPLKGEELFHEVVNNAGDK